MKPPPPPDVTTMLPGAARKALTEWALQRMLQEGLYENSKPKFQWVNVLHETRHLPLGSWACTILHECFLAAEAEFNRRHPLCWDNDTQRAYRKGLQSRKS